MGGPNAASLPGRRKQRRLGQHEAALQREHLLAEIQKLSEQETSQVVFAHKARVLLGTAWFQATWSGKQDILRGWNGVYTVEFDMCTKPYPSWRRARLILVRQISAQAD
jgi:hypothetical protein